MSLLKPGQNVGAGFLPGIVLEPALGLERMNECDTGLLVSLPGDQAGWPECGSGRDAFHSASRNREAATSHHDLLR